MRTYAEKFPRLPSRRALRKSYGKNAAYVRPPPKHDTNTNMTSSKYAQLKECPGLAATK